jgi:AraC-like DNA-binding protein
VERAVHLLKTASASVEEVAARVGYADGATLRTLLRRRPNVGVVAFTNEPTFPPTWVRHLLECREALEDREPGRRERRRELHRFPSELVVDPIDLTRKSIHRHRWREAP